MKKWVAALPLMMVVFLLFAGIASAHVEISPDQALQGTFQQFTVRVPNERKVPAVKLELVVPAEVDISQLHPVPGWGYSLTKDGTGKITKIDWTATGTGIAPSEFETFTIAGLISKQAATLHWKAHQTYKDGTVVDWTGDEKSDTPAPVTEIKPVPKNVTVSDDGDISTTDTTVSDGAAASKLPLYLSIVAVILALLSLIVSMRKAGKVS